MVEHNSEKVGVGGSIPLLGKSEVVASSATCRRGRSTSLKIYPAVFIGGEKGS